VHRLRRIGFEQLVEVPDAGQRPLGVDLRPLDVHFLDDVRKAPLPGPPRGIPSQPPPHAQLNPDLLGGDEFGLRERATHFDRDILRGRAPAEERSAPVADFEIDVVVFSEGGDDVFGRLLSALGVEHRPKHDDEEIDGGTEAEVFPPEEHAFQDV